VFTLAGCESVKHPIDPLTRSYEPTNISTREHLPIEVRRVAVLPAWSPRELADSSYASVDRAFQVALTRSARFEVVPVSLEQMREWVRTPRVSSVGMIPANLIPALREQLAADAVLFVDITHHSAYPPLSLGLRTRLVRLDDGTDLWAADELFDAARANTAAGARRHHAKGPDAPTDMSPTALQSPARFAQYAADTLARTLPAR
jgi:hypothetical protein